MKRFALPLFALGLLVSACSSTQSAKSTQPVPAKSAGIVDTKWGSLPAYQSPEGTPFTALPAHLPRHAKEYTMQIDLLVERDGAVRDVAVRKSSGIPEVDHVVTAEFRKVRSRLTVPENDPAPYVIQWQLSRRFDETATGIPQSSPNDYRFADTRPMGTGEPTPRDRGY